MLAYQSIIMDPEFSGRFALLAPMTLGQRAALEAMIRGGGKPRPGVKPASVARRQAIKGGASESAADFWFTQDGGARG